VMAAAIFSTGTMPSTPNRLVMPNIAFRGSFEQGSS
jgi:hypothetical protein